MSYTAKETNSRRRFLLFPNVQEAVDLRLFLPSPAVLIVLLGVNVMYYLSSNTILSL